MRRRVWLLGLTVSCGPSISPPSDDIGSSTTAESSAGSSTSSGATVTSMPEDDSTSSDEETTAGTTSEDTTAESTTAEEIESDDGIVDACGDGLISGLEECDCSDGPCTPESFDFAECVDVDPDQVSQTGLLTGGVLGCNPASCRFETSMCTWCGDGEIGENESCEPDMPTPTCAELGLGDDGVDPVPCTDLCVLDTSVCG